VIWAKRRRSEWKKIIEKTVTGTGNRIVPGFQRKEGLAVEAGGKRIQQGKKGFPSYLSG